MLPFIVFYIRDNPAFPHLICDSRTELILFERASRNKTIYLFSLETYNILLSLHISVVKPSLNKYLSHSITHSLHSSDSQQLNEIHKTIGQVV